MIGTGSRRDAAGPDGGWVDLRGIGIGTGGVALLPCPRNWQGGIPMRLAIGAEGTERRP